MRCGRVCGVCFNDTSATQIYTSVLTLSLHDALPICAVLGRSPVPVLLLPPAYREVLPLERVLVPVSGELEGDEALALAVRLANALDLAVHVAHVTEDRKSTRLNSRP